MADAKMGLEIKSCAECQNRNVGMRLFDMFSWLPDRVNFMLAYDREREVIIVDEAMLMNAITMVNPSQKHRKLELGDVRRFRMRKEAKELEDNA